MITSKKASLSGGGAAGGQNKPVTLDDVLAILMQGFIKGIRNVLSAAYGTFLHHTKVSVYSYKFGSKTWYSIFIKLFYYMSPCCSNELNPDYCLFLP